MQFLIWAFVEPRYSYSSCHFYIRIKIVNYKFYINFYFIFDKTAGTSKIDVRNTYVNLLIVLHALLNFHFYLINIEQFFYNKNSDWSYFHLHKFFNRKVERHKNMLRNSRSHSWSKDFFAPILSLLLSSIFSFPLIKRNTRCVKKLSTMQWGPKFRKIMRDIKNTNSSMIYTALLSRIRNDAMHAVIQWKCYSIIP